VKRVRPPARRLIVALAVLVLTGLALLATAALAAAADTARVERERDAKVLVRAADRLLARTLTDPFERMKNRVPRYGDWVYGWLSSIWISYDVLMTGAGSIGSQLYRMEPPDPTAVRRAVERYVVGQFERQVIVPRVFEDQVQTAWSRTIARIRDLDRRLAERRVAHLTAAGADQASRERAAQGLLDGWTPDRPTVLSRLADASMLDPDETRASAAGLVLTRSFRPLATRVLSVGTRFVIVPAIGGVMLIPGLDPAGAAGTTAMTALVVAGLWALDYAANALDAASNRAAFEADLRAAIDVAAHRAVTDARAGLRRDLCRELGAGAGGGC